MPQKVKNMSKDIKNFFVELPPINGFVEKTAEGDPGNDTQFEQAFSNLAHAYLKDKAPGLLDYEVGFELMERNEDNTKAVGVFGFKVGPQWLYAPVFFINGDLKGHELLFLKDQDQFVPLKENWLNYILRRKPASLGKKTDQNMARLGFLAPDLQAFTRPPTKFASTKQAFPTYNTSEGNKPNTADNNYSSSQPAGSPLKRDPSASVAGWNGGHGGTGLEYSKQKRDPSRSTPGYNGGQGGTGTQGPRRPAPSPMQQPMRQQYPGNSGASMGVPGGFKSGAAEDQPAGSPLKRDPSATIPGWNGGHGGTGLEYPKAKRDPAKSTPGYNGGQGGTGTQGPRRPAASSMQQPMQQPVKQQYPGNSGASMGVPGGYKAGSDDRKEMLEGLRQLAKYACTNPEFDPKYKNRLTLKTFLKKEASRGKESYKQLVTSLLNTCQKFPKIAEAVEKVYGSNFLKEAVETYKNLKTPGVLDGPVKVATHYKSALTIVVKSFNSSSDGVMGASEEEKKKLITDGVIFNDARSADELAIPYKVQQPTSLENPSNPGVYDLLISPFAMRRVVVFTTPHGPKGREDFATVVGLDNSDHHWINSHPGNLFIRDPKDGSQDSPYSLKSKNFKDVFEAMDPISKLKSGNIYMAVSENGDSSVPFTVLKEVGEADGTKTYRVSYEDWACQSRPTYLPDVMRSGYNKYLNDSPKPPGGGSLMYVTSKPGTRIKSIRGDLYIPGNFKILKLSDSKKDGGCITPGSLNDLQHAIYQKTASLNVRHSGSEVMVNGQRFNPEDALIHLVRDVSMGESHARAILKEAAHKKVVDYRLYKPENAGDLIKAAAPGDNIDQTMMGGPASPAFPVEPTGMEQTLMGSVKSTYPSEQSVPAFNPSIQGNNALYDPRLPDPKTMAIGYNAATTGQKDVFDTSMIGSLVKSVRDDSMVDSHLGDLMKGLDKLGRILFSFYWHRDKFEDRYGKKDLPELEDGLRNSFEQLGDLLLFLKQKTINAYPDEGISLEGDA